MPTKPIKPVRRTTPPQTSKPAVLASSTLLNDVREILRSARRQAYAAVNTIMVDAYWKIGRRIVEEEQGGKARAGYGQTLIRNLVRQLGDEFGNGVSVANLKNFRQFYLAFPDAGKSYALRSQLSWTHWRLIMRVDNVAAREYYISECAEQNWKTRQLERHIATHLYERLLEKPSTGTQHLSTPTVHKPAEFIRDSRPANSPTRTSARWTCMCVSSTT